MAVKTSWGAESADGFWDLYSGVYDSVYELIPYRELLGKAYRALGLRPGMRVLDAGCGTGNFERFVSQAGVAGVTVEGVDFSQAMLDVAARKCASLPQTSFRRLDLSRPLPFDDCSFDRIVSINVLYALPDPDATMREFVRVLAPGGVAVISSPLPEFRVTPLVADHLRKLRGIQGAGRRLSALLRTLRVLVTTGARQWALNNLVIDRREAEGRYHSLDSTELRDLLERRRPDGLVRFSITSALAGQNLFARASKHTAPARAGAATPVGGSVR